MIFINKNSVNNVFLTLNEELNIPYSSTNFLFHFISRGSNQDLFFLAKDISNSTSRCNQFQIIESGSSYSNITGNTPVINIAPGWFSYTIVANQQATLSPTGSTCEYGIGYVSGSSIQQSYIYGSGNQIYVNNTNV